MNTPSFIVALIAAVVIGLMTYFFKEAREKDAVARASFDRAVEVEWVKITSTGDTLYHNEKLKYVLTGQSRLYGGLD